MKILLINPYCVSDGITPPLGLGFLSGAVNDIAEVTILDLIKENEKGTGKLIAFIRQGRYDLVGFKTIEPNYLRVKEYLRKIKETVPAVITVVGGPQASILRDKMADFYDRDADFIICGEGEISFRELCLVLMKHQCQLDTVRLDELSGISGLQTRINGFAITNEFVPIRDISGLKVDWTALKPDEYPPVPHAGFSSRFPVTSVAISRGCPHHCSFCAAHNVMGREVRYRSLEVVIREIRTLTGQYGMKELHIIDDNFITDTAYVEAFCRRLIEEGFNLRWSLPNGTRLEHLNDSLLDLMKRSGLYSLSVGIESASLRILKLMHKNLDLEKTAERIRLIKKHGILVTGFFILGYPTETRREMMETVDFSLRIPLDLANFMLFHPYEGTEAYEQARDSIKTAMDSTFADVAFIPSGLTETELKNIQRYAFLRFYLRPRIFIHLLREIIEMQGKKYIFRRILRWLF
ncbi:MAG: B12-binding domain-containing radical SAM protein [Candidatus Aureabacteria bacterium]|nr:B12-binding domain-containing radical SAM protein [Candidatus Auribacterota bacterium]